MQQYILAIFHLSLVSISFIIQLCVLMLVLFVSFQSAVDHIFAVIILVEICDLNFAT